MPPMTYRLFREEDIPGLIRLWEQNSGWGSLSPETWRKWYLDTPQGECLVVVGLDEHGDIAAQAVATPSFLAAGGNTWRAGRLSAPIVRKDLRTLSIQAPDHPVQCMLKLILSSAEKAGYAAIYVLPERSWLPFFRRLNRYSCTTFPCVGVEHGAPLPQGPDGLEACTASCFGAEYDRLWEQAAASFPVDPGVVRSGAWLQFKNGGHYTVEVREKQGKSLVGYCAVKRETGLIMDLLSRTPDDLTGVLLLTLRQCRETPELRGAPRICAMQTPFLAPHLERAGFLRVEFTFAFVCTALTPHLPLDRIEARRWHVMPGD